MIQFLETIKSQFISFTLSFETLLKIGILSKRTKIPKVGKEKETIWILANGPSLKDNLEYFHETSLVTGVVNYFANHDSYGRIRPSFYFLQAPEFWLDDLIESYIENRILLFNNIAKKTNWPLTLFIPIKSKKYQKNYQPLISHPFIELVYYNDTPVEGLPFVSYFMFRRQLGMPRPHNILIPSIMLSIQMGFKELYLLGVDHSWLPELSVDQQNNALLSQKHFYDGDKVKSETMKKMGKGQRRLHEILHKFYLTFKGYFTIKEFAEQNGIRIYNCTKNSFIDAFDKKDISSILVMPAEQKT